MYCYANKPLERKAVIREWRADMTRKARTCYQSNRLLFKKVNKLKETFGGHRAEIISRRNLHWRRLGKLDNCKGEVNV